MSSLQVECHIDLFDEKKQVYATEVTLKRSKKGNYFLD